MPEGAALAAVQGAAERAAFIPGGSVNAELEELARRVCQAIETGSRDDIRAALEWAVAAIAARDASRTAISWGMAQLLARVMVELTSRYLLSPSGHTHLRRAFTLIPSGAA